MKKNYLAATTLLLLLCLSGCAAPGRDRPNPKETTPLISPTDAKATALAMDRAILEAIPSRFVASHQTQEVGGFYPCTGGGWTWYNHVFLTFTPDYDVEEILGSIEDHWRADETVEVGRSRGITGSFRLVLAGIGESSYFVDIDESDATGDIAAFSPCLELPEGADHRDKF